MGLFDTPDDTLKLDPKAVQQSLSRLNSMRPTAPPAPPAPKERGLWGETGAAVKRMSSGTPGLACPTTHEPAPHSPTWLSHPM